MMYGFTSSSSGLLMLVPELDCVTAALAARRIAGVGVAG